MGSPTDVKVTGGAQSFSLPWSSEFFFLVGGGRGQVEVVQGDDTFKVPPNIILSCKILVDSYLADSYFYNYQIVSKFGLDDTVKVLS